MAPTKLGPRRNEAAGVSAQPGPGAPEAPDGQRMGRGPVPSRPLPWCWHSRGCCPCQWLMPAPGPNPPGAGFTFRPHLHPCSQHRPSEVCVVSPAGGYRCCASLCPHGLRQCDLVWLVLLALSVSQPLATLAHLVFDHGASPGQSGGGEPAGEAGVPGSRPRWEQGDPPGGRLVGSGTQAGPQECTPLSSSRFLSQLFSAWEQGLGGHSPRAHQKARQSHSSRQSRHSTVPGPAGLRADPLPRATCTAPVGPQHPHPQLLAEWHGRCWLPRRLAPFSGGPLWPPTHHGAPLNTHSQPWADTQRSRALPHGHDSNQSPSSLPAQWAPHNRRFWKEARTTRHGSQAAAGVSGEAFGFNQL